MGVWHEQPVNVPADTALIFEGGGLRCTYSSAICNVLLENGIHFGHVYGVSAGASCAIGYLAGDQSYMYGSFAGMTSAANVGGWGYFLQHRGYFNAREIYVSGVLPGGAGPYPYEEAMENPTQATIQAFERDTGRSVFFTKQHDFKQGSQHMMDCVRASSTVPILMPPPKIDGKAYYDGGLANGYGILLHRALADGHRRAFIVRTRPRGYRKAPVGNPGFYRVFFWRRPYMASAIIGRTYGYNALLDEIDRLEQKGLVYQVFPEDLRISSGELDYHAVQRDYEAGYEQALREVDAWKGWLGVS